MAHNTIIFVSDSRLPHADINSSIQTPTNGGEMHECGTLLKRVSSRTVPAKDRRELVSYSTNAQDIRNMYISGPFATNGRMVGRIACPLRIDIKRVDHPIVS